MTVIQTVNDVNTYQISFLGSKNIHELLIGSNSVLCISGLWKLEVSHNDVSEIPSMAFYGLERALWELHLSHNKLIRVPADSITLLKKLSVLNLAGNIEAK